jgi:hypothetical protein
MNVKILTAPSYVETIDLVYSRNHFDTDCVSIMAYLPRILLPQRIHAIQSFNFTWTVVAPPSFPHPQRCAWNEQSEKMEKAKRKIHYHRQTWELAWKNLAAMEGLVNLRVTLNTKSRVRYSQLSNSDLWKVEELEIVKTVTRPRNFQLVLHAELARRAREEITGPNLEIIELVVEGYD